MRYVVVNLGSVGDPDWVVRDSWCRGQGGVVYRQPEEAGWPQQAWVVSRRMNGRGGRKLEMELRRLERKP